MSNKHRASQRNTKPQPQIWYNCLKERTVLAPVVDALEDIAMVAGKYGIMRLSQPPCRTDQARNWLTKKFLEVTAADGRKPLETDTLIMLDNDHLHHRYTLLRLAMAITGRDEGRGIVVALAERRLPPYDPLAYVRGDDGKLYPVKPNGDGLIECVRAGHGAIAIARWVFENLEAAGFHYPYWRYAYKDGNDVSPSEDMYFGECCEAAGISHWVDGGLEAPHFVNRTITIADTEQYMREHPELNTMSIAAKVEYVRGGIINDGA